MDFQMKGKAGPDLIQTICFDLPISPVISSSGKASFTPCSPKAEEAQGLHHPPPPLLTAHLSPLLYTHTHTHIFTIHTHTGLSFESLGLDLKFLFRACHAFYMHGEWERERRDCGGLWGGGFGGWWGGWGHPTQMNFPPLLLSSGIYLYTPPSLLSFAPRPSFSRAHSTLSTLVLLHNAFHKFHRTARAP